MRQDYTRRISSIQSRLLGTDRPDQATYHRFPLECSFGMFAPPEFRRRPDSGADRFKRHDRDHFRTLVCSQWGEEGEVGRFASSPGEDMRAWRRAAHYDGFGF